MTRAQSRRSRPIDRPQRGQAARGAPAIVDRGRAAGRSAHQSPAVVLAPGREKSVARRHPWIFSGAIAQEIGGPAVGDTVRVESAHGAFLAWGAFSPSSQIRVRLWSWREDEPIDAAFITRRIEASIARRAAARTDPAAAMRLVNAEADGLPGLIVDQYADVVVAQLLSAAVERWRATIIEALCTHTRCSSLYERSDVEVRALEGLPLRTGELAGAPPPDLVDIVEVSGAYRARYRIDVRNGHKTGFYLDQAHNRDRIARLCTGRTMLNCFSYTGAFSITALLHGASHVVSIDSSREAMALAQAQATLNHIDPARAEWVEADVFAKLRELRAAGAQFDVIVLDPPKFAPTAGHVQRAARAYKDINLIAFQLLIPGGTLATFSCSGAIDAALFQSIVAGAAQDAGVDVQLEDRLHAATDHVISLSFPEGEYLKGLLLHRR